MSAPGIVIFALTYLLISARPFPWLDRSAAALVGAAACVAASVLSPAEALAAIDLEPLLLLFAVMGMGGFLAVDGFFEQIEARLSAASRTPAQLLGAVVWGAGVLAALITNDAVCVLGTPLIVRLVRRHGLPPLPFLLALATAANTGSVATLVGNPQNMLCALLGGLGYLRHLLLMLPIGAASLAMNHLLLARLFRRELAAAALASPPTTDAAPPRISGRSKTTLAVVVASVVVYSAGGNLAWTAAGGLALLLLVHRSGSDRLWPQVSWPLLVFFAGLFVVVQGFIRSGAPAAFFAHVPLANGGSGLRAAARLAGLFLFGSNIVSNVPFILVVREQMAALPDPRFGWELLAMASTFAGNLTLIGSAANVIVAESSREIGGIGFWPYLRVGLPLALATTFVGVLWLSFLGAQA